MAPSNRPRIHIHYLERPGRTLPPDALRTLVEELREVAAACFKDVPDYQCLSHQPGELDDKVITLARDASGQLLGFCSAVLLPVPTIGNVLHLGLTCVRPGGRGGGLTHTLTSSLVTRYFLRHHLLSRLWITSIACVLSSLGNTALNFDEVHPSPFTTTPQSPKHRAIARTIDEHWRHKAYVLPTAVLDAEQLVFRGSVRGTVFQKDADDRRYHHRDAELNAFYAARMNFQDGDEVLQIGHVSLRTVLRYVGNARQRAAKRKGSGAVSARRVAGEVLS